MVEDGKEMVINWDFEFRSTSDMIRTFMSASAEGYNKVGISYEPDQYPVIIFKRED